MSKIRTLRADEIEVRFSQVFEKGALLLLYKTARVDRSILDETFGDLWQNDFKVIDGKMYGGIGIYNEKLKEWLWRWDCGTESNTEAEKGQASDCFKRAGFKWGIGVELYSSPLIFVPVETFKDQKYGKYVLKDRFMKFEVSHIDYKNGEISELVIKDTKGGTWFTWKKGTKNQVKQKEAEPDHIVKFNKTMAKLEKISDASIDMASKEAESQISFVSNLLFELKEAGLEDNAKQLEKLFNSKLKKPERK